jgi:hypothetical protein
VSYRPITDTWILARPKVSYYGAYPNGFLERARVFMPVTRTEPVLHVCGGSAKLYPTWSRLCPNDLTCDIDPELKPDVVWNVRTAGVPGAVHFPTVPLTWNGFWRGILMDPPYTEADAEKYRLGRGELPSAKAMVESAIEQLCVGGRVGILHYVFPRPPAVGVKLIAKCSVVVGYGNRERAFTVFEKL